MRELPAFQNQQTLNLEDEEYQTVTEGRIRIRIGVAAFIFMLLIAIVRLAEISLFSSNEHQQKLPQAIKIKRADLTDRNGELLATTLETYSLYAEPRRVWNSRETADALVKLRPHLNREDIQQKLEMDRSFVWLERGLTPKARQAVFGLGLPGLAFRKEPKRAYPRENLASHLVGFTNLDMVGVAGAERAFNSDLMTDDAPAVALSLDLRVQFALADELAKAHEAFKALDASGVVMDMRTGEIIAMASVPNFNPNDPDTTMPETLFNHAAMSTYELGSVFKPLTMAMALEDGVVDKTEMFEVQKPFKVRNKFIRDDHSSKVPLNITGILAESSNRGTAMIAQRIGAERQRGHLRNLGLLTRVDYELAESAKPQVQKHWGEMATVTVSYGHGLSVTPLALIAAISGMLNDGVYVTPMVRKHSVVSPAVGRRVFRSAVSQDMRDMMRFAVTDGTGRKANIPGYGVMGKTGTAEKPSEDGGYDQSRLVTSFVAAFPHSSPRYAMIITLDEPKGTEATRGNAGAGWNAAPVAGQVIRRIGPILPGARDNSQLAGVGMMVTP